MVEWNSCYVFSKVCMLWMIYLYDKLNFLFTAVLFQVYSHKHLSFATYWYGWVFIIYKIKFFPPSYMLLHFWLISNTTSRLNIIYWRKINRTIDIHIKEKTWSRQVSIKTVSYYIYHASGTIAYMIRYTSIARPFWP